MLMDTTCGNLGAGKSPCGSCWMRIGALAVIVMAKVRGLMANNELMVVTSGGKIEENILKRNLDVKNPNGSSCAPQCDPSHHRQ